MEGWLRQVTWRWPTLSQGPPPFRDTFLIFSIARPKTTEVIRKSSITAYTDTEDNILMPLNMFRIGEQDYSVNMWATKLYKKVITHGIYYGNGLNAIVVFSV